MLEVRPSRKGQGFVLTSVGTYSGYRFTFSACSASVKTTIHEPTEGLFPVMVFHITLCCREKPILTSRWSCSFDLLSFAFVVIIIQNGLPQRILPLCLTIKLKCLCSEPWRCQEGRNEHIPCLRFVILGDICKINGLFTLFPHLPASHF